MISNCPHCTGNIIAEDGDMFCGKCGSVFGNPTCFNCGIDQTVIDYSTGTTICTGCGCVRDQNMIDDSPEWINGEEGEDKSRVGAPVDPLLNVRSTFLGVKHYHDRSFKRINRYHQQMAMDYNQRAMYHTYKEMTRVAETILRMPDNVIFQAKEFYKDVKDARLSRGMVHKALIAACVYYACKVQKQEGLSRSKTDVGRAYDIPEKAMSAACKLFKEITADKPYHKDLFETMAATDLIHKVVSRFGFDRDMRIQVTRNVRSLDDRIKSSGIMDGKSPNSVLSAILYVVFQKLAMDVPKKDIVEKCEVSLVTLNKMIAALGV